MRAEGELPQVRSRGSSTKRDWAGERDKTRGAWSSRTGCKRFAEWQSWADPPFGDFALTPIHQKQQQTTSKRSCMPHLHSVLKVKQRRCKTLVNLSKVREPGEPRLATAEEPDKERPGPFTLCTLPATLHRERGSSCGRYCRRVRCAHRQRWWCAQRTLLSPSYLGEGGTSRFPIPLQAELAARQFGSGHAGTDLGKGCVAGRRSVIAEG